MFHPSRFIGVPVSKTRDTPEFQQSRAGAFGGQAIMIFIPKSGRTWVRTFLCSYFCKRHGHPFTLDPNQYRDPAIPRIIFSHYLFEHRTRGSFCDWLRGKYLVPAEELRRAKIVLLVRDLAFQRRKHAV